MRFFGSYYESMEMKINSCFRLKNPFFEQVQTFTQNFHFYIAFFNKMMYNIGKYMKVFLSNLGGFFNGFLQ